MKHIFLICLFLFQISKICGQGYKEVYYPGVADIEVFVIDFWLEKGGKVTDVKEVVEKSTYHNPELYENLKTTLENKSFDEKYEGDRIRAEFFIKLINPKYENQKLDQLECEKLNFLRDGKFSYDDPFFKDIVVERHGREQIEKTEKIVLKADIEWISNCEYNLIYPESSDDSFYKKDDVVHVEIIGILDDHTVVYRSIFNDLVCTSKMKKL